MDGMQADQSQKVDRMSGDAGALIDCKMIQ